jgi:glycosyltransferase involved in cell wall biosynthesis
VSVVVPAYGVGELLADALASLQAQAFANWEAIVVDDGARGAVARVFDRFADDPRFRLLQTDNGGVSVARNRGIAAARAPFVSFLDGDDVYEPQYLARMASTLAANPALGFVACDAVVFGAGVRRPHRYSDRYPMAGPASLERVLSREVNIFTATMARRRALLQVGGFDAELPVAEDLDLWARLIAAGWGARVLDEALVRYRRRAGSLSSAPRRLLAGSCAMYRKAAAELEARPEGRVAEAMASRCEEQLRWMDGEELILAGHVRAGLALLRTSESRSPRWGKALRLMQRAPWIAPWLLRGRRWAPPPRAA